MSHENDPEIIDSPLSRAVTQDGITVGIMIYRLEHEVTWALEVVDEFGGSTTWDDPFPTEQDALREALACIAKEGIASFVVEDADIEEPKTLH